MEVVCLEAEALRGITENLKQLKGVCETTGVVPGGCREDAVHRMQGCSGTQEDY